MDSALTGIDERGPRYRGKVAVELAEQGVAFEATAELLWSGELANSRPRWKASELGVRLGDVKKLFPEKSAPLAVLPAVVALLALRDPLRFDAPEETEQVRARQLLLRMAASLFSGGPGQVLREVHRHFPPAAITPTRPRP